MINLLLIAEGVNGDARKALNVLESVVIASDEIDGETIVEDWLIENLLGRIGLFGDNKGSHFYNLLSALQKSVRGSDVNAAIYYLAHLLETGDFIAVHRRLLVMAYEDVGLASPEVGPHVLAATEAAVRLGMPEARIPLANAVIEMCLASKSNSAYKAFDAAVNAINDGKTGDIPLHLRDAHYAGAANLVMSATNIRMIPHSDLLVAGLINNTYPINLKALNFISQLSQAKKKSWQQFMKD